MKSAELYSSCESFFEACRVALRSHILYLGDDEICVQLKTPDGKLFTLFNEIVPRQWCALVEFPQGFDTSEVLYSFSAECRWEEFFCDVMHWLSARVPPFIIVDSDTKVHLPDTVQPDQIYL